MRTTIDLPDALFRRVKARAAEEGRTLKSYVTDAVVQKLEGQDTGEAIKTEKRRTLPFTVPSPRIDLTNQQIEELLSDPS